MVFNRKIVLGEEQSDRGGDKEIVTWSETLLDQSEPLQKNQNKDLKWALFKLKVQYIKDIHA